MSDSAKIVEVLLDHNLQKPLDYLIPDEWSQVVAVGMRVEVPVKTTLRKGTIFKIRSHSSFSNLRSISRLLSEKEELSDSMWQLANWMSRYYATPFQRILQCFIPANIRREIKPQKRLFISLNVAHERALKTCSELQLEYPEEAKLLQILLNIPKGCFLVDLEEKGISKQVIEKLKRKKIIKSQSIAYEPDLLLEEEFFQTSPKTLNLEQKNCLDAIETSLLEKSFCVHLIQGVTGSGKTEIYLQAIQKTLELGLGAILLVPEIALTSQTIERFRSRFSEKIAVLHHKRSFGERTLAWEDLKNEKARIAIGARSAIFAPMPKLGLIIVDEEHDASYKQGEEAPFYHARNVAVMRAHIEKIPIVLGSATPSIESRHNATIGKYKFHTLASRATKASLPKVRIIDMKKAFEMQGGFTHFSSELLEGIKERISRGEQTLLFFNRRGFHRLQICSVCQEAVKCPHCDLGLTFHRASNLLCCHLCDFHQEPRRKCPKCGSFDPLEFKGFGIEHAERALHAIFPDIRTLRMDRDTTSRKDSHEEIFKQFRSHKADVLIGTQMIAKGFHFPSVTLVGILNADAPLNIPDFRSSENIFQILTQVAGRSGRSELEGEVILQTFLPDHPVLKLAAAQDYEAFFLKEIEERRLFNFPPFTHLIKCAFFSKEAKTAEETANSVQHTLTQKAPSFAQILPVTAAGHPKVKDLYRFQFLIKTSKVDPIVALLQEIEKPKTQMKIDVDPLSTFF